MAERGKYYWIKLKTDFFDLPEIDWLTEQENGYAYVVLYQKLCLLTANSSGVLIRKIGEMIIPYDAKKIAEITKFDIDTVFVAMNLYQKLGLIYEQTDGTLCLSAAETMVGSETKWAEKKRLQRSKKSCEALPSPPEGQKEGQIEDNVPFLSEDIVREEYRDKILDTRYPDTDTTPQTHVSYEEIKSLFNDICKSYPKVQKMSEARKKTIKARFNEGYTMEDFKTLFENAEKSSFLKGQANSEWSANFDWLIKGTNIAKVIDGNYGDKQKPQAERIGDLDDLF